MKTVAAVLCAIALLAVASPADASSCVFMGRLRSHLCWLISQNNGPDRSYGA